MCYYFIIGGETVNIGYRIKQIRKALDLTQTEFADRIGSVQNTVTGYESGRRNPSTPVISLICREFGVNEQWLRDGVGEMFAPAATSALDALAQEQNLTHGEYILIEKLLHLKPEVRQGILDYIMEVAAAVNSNDLPTSVPDAQEMSEAELHAELDRQLGIEKEAGEMSEVS